MNEHLKVYNFFLAYYESDVQKSTDENISLIEKILIEKEKEILTL